MASQINVPPVVGYTPVQVATELRSLIRDGIWQKAKLITSGVLPKPKSSLVATNKQFIEASLNGQEGYLDAIDELLTLLSKEATLRKPTIVRSRVDLIRIHLQAVRSRKKDAMVYAARLIPKDDPDTPPDVPMVVKELLSMCERAYSLVQALPTIDNPAIGREANTIRAITAILKVHYGLEVQGTVEKLPEMMPLLLEAIKKPQEPAPPLIEPELWVPGASVTKFDPKWGFKLEQEPVLPSKIMSQTSGPLGAFVFSNTEKITKVSQHGWLPPGAPPTNSKGWNKGDCSPFVALGALIALRMNYSDKFFQLVDSSGKVFAIAIHGQKLDLRYGFGDVLYHLRKEHKENAKSQAPPLILSNTTTIITSSVNNPF